MSITRTKTNFAFGEKLTHDQMNALDTNVTNALDKRSGQTDTLASAVTITGATTVSGTLALNGTTTVTAPIVTSNTITTSSGLVFSPGNTVTGNMHLAGTQTVDSGGGIILASGATFGTVSGSIVIGTSVAINGGTISGATITGGSVGAASGIATLDSSSKLTSTQRGGWIVAMGQTVLASNFSSTSTTYVDVTGLSCSITGVVAGDKILVDLSVVGAVALSGTFAFKAMVNDSGTDYDVGQEVRGLLNAYSAVIYPSNASRSFVYTALNSGTLTVRVQSLGTVSTGHYVYGTANNCASTIRLTQIRP